MIASALAVAPVPAASAPKKVLLIDDSTTTHLWVKMLIGRTEYELVSARDGDEGVRAALSERPDMILMDAMMPRMNGFEATRAIRREPLLRDVPILMLTTRSAPQNVAAAVESGCTDFVVKPIDGLALLSKLHSYLQG